MNVGFAQYSDKMMGCRNHVLHTLLLSDYTHVAKQCFCNDLIEFRSKLGLKICEVGCRADDKDIIRILAPSRDSNVVKADIWRDDDGCDAVAEQFQSTHQPIANPPFLKFHDI